MPDERGWPSAPWEWMGGYPQRIIAADAILVAEVWENPDKPAVIAPLICEGFNAFVAGLSEETEFGLLVQSHELLRAELSREREARDSLALDLEAERTVRRRDNAYLTKRVRELEAALRRIESEGDDLSSCIARGTLAGQDG